MNSPQISSSQNESDSSYRAIAPSWHTVLVLAVLLGVSFAGARSGNMPGARHGRTLGYLAVMLFEWATIAFIWWGMSRRGARVRELIGGSWPRAVDVLRDLGIAIGFLIVSGIILNGLGYLLKAKENQAIRNLFPHGRNEIIFFLLLALTAGFCEEVIFRGYLQRQFTAATHSVVGGILLQGVAFGLGHGYQGWKLMLVISVFGTLFGLLARWRRSLRPGMIAHFLQDGVGGIVASHLTH